MSGHEHKRDVTPARSALPGRDEGQQLVHPSEFSSSLPPCWCLSFIISVLFQLHLAAAFWCSFRAERGERRQGATASGPCTCPQCAPGPCSGQRDRDTRTPSRTSSCCHTLLSAISQSQSPTAPCFLSSFLSFYNLFFQVTYR